MPYVAHWKFNQAIKKKSGYQTFNRYSADKFNIAYNFNLWNKTEGLWCKFRDIGQNIQILV